MGSEQFKLQRRLGEFLMQAKEWCITFKKEKSIIWSEINSKLTDSQTDIQDLQSAEESLHRARNMKKEIELKWEFWKQRSKSKWDTFGDYSTGFFYKSVKSRGLRNEIKAIRNAAGEWIDNQEESKTTFCNHFKALLSPNNQDILINNSDPIFQNLRKLSDHQKASLQTPFSKE